MELIKLINNQHDQIHQHLKAELEQLKSLNLMRNRNSDPPESLKNQGEHSEKTASLLNQQENRTQRNIIGPNITGRENRYKNNHHQLATRTKYHKNGDKKLQIGKVNVVNLRMPTEMKKVTRRNLPSLLQETA